MGSLARLELYAPIRLSDVFDLAAPRIEVACEKCGLKGSYSVAKLYAERGDLKLTDFLPELTSACPNARSIGWHERCAAGFVL